MKINQIDNTSYGALPFIMHNGLKLPKNNAYLHKAKTPVELRTIVQNIYGETAYDTIISSRGKEIGNCAIQIENNALDILCLSIMPEKRGKDGFGGALLLHAVATMLTNGLDRIEVVSRQSAVDFYQHFNFASEKCSSAILLALKKGDVLGHRNYFNEAFIKYGIDYRI